MTRFTATELDADGTPQPVVAEDPWDSVDPEPERADNSLGLLLWLAEGRTPKQRSRRLEAALYLARTPGSARTVRELAKKLGLGKTQTGQILAKLRAKLGLRP